jgi:hypothetical protein
MRKNEILHVLMTRDNMDRMDAIEVIREAKRRVLAGEDPEMVLEEEFGLEPDYIFDLI